MKERPILFSAPMVRAILDGSKTQTRRVVKWQGPKKHPHDFNLAFLDNPAGVKRLCVPYEHPNDGTPSIDSPAHRHYCPYGDPGDRLWVRETWCKVYDAQYGEADWIDYRATPKYSDIAPAGWHEDMEDPARLRWKPSIHMPRSASRIDLEITGVRVERLQEMTEEDAKAEGTLEWLKDGMVKYTKGQPWEEAVRFDKENPFRAAFGTLWESINGPGSWDANPWVWVIEFRRIKP